MLLRQSPQDARLNEIIGLGFRSEQGPSIASKTGYFCSNTVRQVVHLSPLTAGVHLFEQANKTKKTDDDRAASFCEQL